MPDGEQRAVRLVLDADDVATHLLSCGVTSIPRSSLARGCSRRNWGRLGAGRHGGDEVADCECAQREAVHVMQPQVTFERAQLLLSFDQGPDASGVEEGQPRRVNPDLTVTITDERVEVSAQHRSGQ
jgi:hypothetical protein